jgi:hypothetical protein
MKTILLLLSLCSLQAFAAPSFTNITTADFENISKEMSANFTHNSLMGAAKMGTVFGFQLGFTGAQTSSPNTDAVAVRTAGSELPKLYNAGLMAAVGMPFGIAIEAVMIPSYSSSGANLSSSSYALKWNIDQVVPALPVNLALRGVYSNAKFDFTQTVSAVDVTVTNKTMVSGLQLLLSPKLPIFEPYVGVGMLNGSNELSVTGSNPIFDPSFSTSQSESKSVSSTQLLAGVEVSLFLVKLGAEYSQAFGTSRYGFKFAFGF